LRISQKELARVEVVIFGRPQRMLILIFLIANQGNLEMEY
jgi:hypothetical protein